MGDPFRHVRRGEPIQFSAAAWNAMLDAALAYRTGRFGPPGKLTSTRSATLLKVRNDTGDDLDRCSVLALDGPIFTPTDSLDAFLREPTFVGTAPTSTTGGKFCVTLDPVRAGGVARAWFAGVCPVQVDVADPTHGYADLADGETGHLKSDPCGSAEILWKEDDAGYYGYGTGVQWALVRLGTIGSQVCFAKVTTEVAKATSTTRPGKGKIQRYTVVDLSTTPATLSNLTGVDEDCVNINQEKKVKVNSTVVAVKPLGVWVVTAPDSCASLLS